MFSKHDKLIKVSSAISTNINASSTHITVCLARARLPFLSSQHQINKLYELLLTLTLEQTNRQSYRSRG